MSDPTMEPHAMLASRPPLDAYRRDLGRRADATTALADDAAARALPLAVLLARVAESPPGEHTALLVALGSAVEALGPRDESGMSARVGSAPWFGAAVRSLANDAEEGGALHLATTMLSIGEQLAASDEIELGRCLAQRARVARKANDLETAEVLYTSVAQLAQRNDSVELRARADLGHGIVAHMRGNHPAARERYARAAADADALGVHDVAYRAHQGLMITAGVAGDPERSLVEGWRALRHAGTDPDRQAEMLLNLGQLLLEMSRPRSALHAFTAAVERTTLPRLALPAWGGLAIAAARERRTMLVDAAARKITAITGTGAPPYERVQAQLDLAIANLEVGRARRAERYRLRALREATAEGFHEFVHRAGVLERTTVTAAPAAVRPATAAPLGAAGRDVVDALERLGDPEALAGRW